MVSLGLLEQARALPIEERWELVDALLETLEPGTSTEELEVAREGLRRYRANPEGTVDAGQFIDHLRRKYA